MNTLYKLQALAASMRQRCDDAMANPKATTVADLATQIQEWQRQLAAISAEF